MDLKYRKNKKSLEELIRDAPVDKTQQIWVKWTTSEAPSRQFRRQVRQGKHPDPRNHLLIVISKRLDTSGGNLETRVNIMDISEAI